MTKEKEMLTKIRKAVKSCSKCRLKKGRVNAVPGNGNSSAEIMFIGEAPGFHEAEQGKPFVGRAGRLLDSLLSSIGLRRDEVWITNVIKDRPPDNRSPLIDEIRACAPYLDEEIKIIRPKLIVLLGKFATEYFIKDGKISRDHGVPKRVKNFIIYPLYHPAAALRSKAVLNVLKEEFKRIPAILDKGLDEIEYANEIDKDKNQMTFL